MNSNTLYLFHKTEHNTLFCILFDKVYCKMRYIAWQFNAFYLLGDE